MHAYIRGLQAFVFCGVEEEGAEDGDGGDGRREGEAFYCVRRRLSDLLCSCREGDGM